MRATLVLLAMFSLDKMPPDFYVDALCAEHRRMYEAMVARARKS